MRIYEAGVVRASAPFEDGGGDGRGVMDEWVGDVGRRGSWRCGRAGVGDVSRRGDRHSIADEQVRRGDRHSIMDRRVGVVRRRGNRGGITEERVGGKTRRGGGRGIVSTYAL